MCGAVRYETDGAPSNILYCHCESCRRHTSAPVVALAGYTADRVRFTQGQRAIYESSPGVRRAFCGNCGSPLTWESIWEGEALIEIHVGSFDHPHTLAPAVHIHHGERIAWFDTADALPRHKGWDGDGEPYLQAPAIVGPRD